MSSCENKTTRSMESVVKKTSEILVLTEQFARSPLRFLLVAGKICKQVVVWLRIVS